MKKFFSVIVVLLLLVPAMAQAVQSLEDTRIARPAPTSEESSGCQMSASGLVSMFGDKIAALKAVIVNKDSETAAELKKKDTETAKELRKKDTETAAAITGFKNELTNEKTGQFAKTNAKIDKANAKIDAVDSSILWMAAAVIIILGLLGMLGFSLIKKALNRVEKKIDTTPEKTAKAVHDYFDPTPFEWDEGKEHIIYEFPTDDKCYRTFKVIDTNGSANPADFEQQIISSGYKAKNFCAGMFKKFREGKIAGTPEETLINFLISGRKIRISKI